MVSRAIREERAGQKGCVLWFTGLSGSGKSTIAHSLEEALFQKGHNAFVLDGDNVRHGLCGDLGFSRSDRQENIRRISEVARIVANCGIIVMTAFISPYREDRAQARQIIGAEDFLEIHCDCTVEVCEKRDVKGLYRKARAGTIQEFTGISAPYEAPESPDCLINTVEQPVEDSVQKLLTMLSSVGVIANRLG